MLFHLKSCHRTPQPALDTRRLFTHVMIGSNDLTRSKAFYDATFMALGGAPGEVDARGRLVYGHGGSRLMITVPIDGKPATVANGGTIGLVASSQEHVKAWHDAGVRNGGRSTETPPCQRPNGSFEAYLRDPDGNKLTARTLTFGLNLHCTACFLCATIIMQCWRYWPCPRSWLFLVHVASVPVTKDEQIDIGQEKRL